MIGKGVTGEHLKRDQPHLAWKELLMTYQSDGAPLLNTPSL